jgi:hypothetical protein
MDRPEFITSTEASKILGISIATFYRLEKAGYLTHSHMNSFKKMYDTEAVKAMHQRLDLEKEARNKEIAYKRAKGSFIYEQKNHTQVNTDTVSTISSINPINTTKNINTINPTTYPAENLVSLVDSRDSNKSIASQLPSQIRKNITSMAKNININPGKIISSLKTLKTFRRQIILPFSMGIILILIPVAYLILRHAEDVEAWFDDNWGYRVRYTINNSGSSETDKKILLEIDTETLISEGKMNEDCSDSGFTTLSGQVLKYYLDETGGACNTSSTNYWVLIPTIHSGTTVIYHYYGNPSAESSAQSEQFTQDTFDPTSITKGSEESSPGPTAYWRLDEGFDKQADSKLEQQIEILNKEYRLASWWDSSWQKRQIIEITNNTQNELTDHQVNLTVTYSPSMNTDFSDLRFAWSDGETQINYWIESYVVGESANVWIKIPSISPNETASIYTYYGNSSATSESNGNNVFVFFDEFLGSAIDTARWTITDATGWSVSEGELRGTNTTGRLTSTQTFSSGVILETKHRTITHPSNGFTSTGFFLTTSDNIGYLVHPSTNYYRNNGSWVDIGTAMPLNTDLFTQFIVKSPTLVDLYTKNYDTNLSYKNYPNISNSVSNEPIVLGRRYDNGNTGQAYDAYWDWVRVRKYVLTEPTVNFKIEEVPGGYNPSTNSLGIIEYDPNKFNGATVYFEAVVSTDGNSWEKVRSSSLNLPNSAKDYTAKIKSGDGSSTTPKVQLYNITDSTSVSEISFGSLSDLSAYIKSARLIITQSHPSAITDTQTHVEIGNNQTSDSLSYNSLTDKKIYQYNAAAYAPAPSASFEASLKADLNEIQIEQQINITGREHSVVANGTYTPTDNSLGLIRWEASKYPGALVYLEAIIRATYGNANAALYSSDGTVVPGSTASLSSTSFGRARSGAINLSNLSDGTSYTVRSSGSGGSNHTAFIKAARLIIIQSDPTKIAETQTQIEVGDSEKQTNNAPTQLTNKKIYYYDSSKFSPAPTAYFEASLRNSQPTIEQQINITGREHSVVANGTYTPTDNSLGLIRWEASKYPGALVYLEAIIRATYGNANAALYSSDGTVVPGSTASLSSTSFGRARSGAINLSNLSDGTSYTVRSSGSGGSNHTAFIKAARLIIIQSDPTKIAETQTQIEVGDSEKQTNNAPTQLTNKKIYYYDSSKFSPAPTAYFEASLRNSQPTIEQQINITGREHSVVANGTYTPTDNSLGLIRWEASKYPGALVYLEAIIRATYGNANAALYSSDGTVVPGSTASLSSTSFGRARSGAINLSNLSDGTSYTVRSSGSGGSNHTAFIKAARLIIIQSDPTKIAETQTQIEVGNNETTTNTAYIPLTNKKIYYYDSSKFSPFPTVYFEASLSNDTAGETAYAALYENDSSCTNMVSGSEVSITGTAWGLSRSAAVTVNTATEYMVCIRGSSGTARIANAKIILHQQDLNGITALETYQHHINTLSTRSGDYTGQGFTTWYNPDLQTAQRSFAGGTLEYFYEATMKTDTGTGLARLTWPATASTISTTSTNYQRVRTGSAITSNLPQFPQNSGINIDTQLSGSGGTVSASSSWIIVQISNLATNGVTTYADLYNLTDGEAVSGSEVSTTSINWTDGLVRSSAITLATNKEYATRVWSSHIGAWVHMQNAKIILHQQDLNGITALETYQHHINTLSTRSGDYTGQGFTTWYNPDLQTAQRSFAGGTLEYFYEATMKTDTGTGLARLTWPATASTISTTSTNYQRVRTGSAITSSLPQFPQNSGINIDTQLSGSGGTVSASSSWIIVQISNLATNGVTTYADLYNLTDGVAVVGSEVSTAQTAWAGGLTRSSGFSLTTNKEYVARLWSSHDGAWVHMQNAKIILHQEDPNGITDLETYQHHINTLATRSASDYSDQNFLTLYDPESIKGGVANYLFESTIETSGGTGYSMLRNRTDNTDIALSEVSTTSTDYQRVRSSDITESLPSTAKNLDTRIKNSGSDTTSVSSSWIIVQISDLGDPPVYAALYENDSSCTNMVSGSEVQVKLSEGWTRKRTSSPISLNNNTEYMVCTKVTPGTSLSISNAKIIHEQSAPSGISKVETLQSMINMPSYDSDTTYTSQDFLNTYNPSNFSGDNELFFEATIKTSAGGGSAQLYSTTESSAIANTELSTSSTSYERKRSVNIATELSSENTLDTQIKNSGSDTTTVSNSWLVIQSTFATYAIIHDSTSNAIHGTLSGGRWNDPSTCKAGSCLTFDGIDDHIFVNDNSRLDFKSTDSFTISLWFKHPKKTNSNPSVIVSKFESVGSDGGYKLYLNPSGTLSFGISDTNTNFPKDIVTSTLSYDDNVWHHLSAVKRGTDGIYLYINGTLVGSNELLTTSGNLTNNDKLHIGIDGDGTSNPFRGVLDEIKIYRYARSDEGVLTDFVRKASSRGSSAVFGIKNETPLFNNLIGHWQMDESEAGTCSDGKDFCDSSGNDLHGTWEAGTTAEKGKFGNTLSLGGLDSRSKIVAGNWASRMQITFDNSDSAVDLNDFPVLVKLDPTRIDYTKTQGNGEDIRFTDYDDTTLLSYEIESWDSTGESFIWVRVPHITAGSTDEYIYMYYNNPIAPDGQNATDVWDGNFQMVQHFQETAGTINYDSTSFNTNLNKVSEVLPLSTQNGFLNGAQSYNGTNAFTSGTTSIPLANASFTISGWIRTNLSADRVWFNAGSSTITNQYLHFRSYTNGSLRLGFFWNDLDTPAGIIAANTWHFVTATFNHNTKERIIYVDGVVAASDTASSNFVGNTNIYVGNSVNSQYWLGEIDEVRLSNSPRSGDWVKADYKSMTDTFVTFGEEEAPTSILDNINTTMTASAWINPSTLDTNSRAIISRGDSPTQDWFIQASGASPGKISFSADGGTNTGLSNTTLATNKWYHIAMSAGNGKTSLYINGKLDSETSFSGSITTEGDIAIGNNPSGGTGWHGLIDEVRLYNTSLSPSEILSLYKWTPGPQAYWNFNEGNGTVLYDKAGNNHAGIWKGTGEYWINGKFGKAGLFNGTNNYVEVGSSILGVRSVSFWVKPYTQTTSILSLSSSASVSVSSGTISATGFVSPTIKVNGKESTTLSENTWQHVSITTDTPITADSIDLGKVSTNYFSGELDEVRIYNYEVTQEQVVRNINVGHNAPGSPLGSASLHLAFDEGYGDTAHDTSPNRNHGSLAGTNTCPGHTSCPSWTNNGKFGKALYFDGSDDYLDMGTTVFTSPNEWTFSVWVKPESGMSSDRIIEYNPTTNGSISKYVSLYMTGTTLSYTGYSAGNFPTVSTTLPLNEWSHIVATYDGTRMTLFVNAKEKGSNVTSLDPWGVAFNTYIGNNANNLTNGPFKGTIDEFKIYNFALSGSQINIEYNQGQSAVWGAPSTESDGTSHSFSAARAYCVPDDTSTCNPPIGEWRFDEKQGTTVRDTSGNNNTGTLTNNPTWLHTTECKQGSCLRFNGSNNYIDAGNNSILQFGTSNFTIQAWVKPLSNSDGAKRGIVSTLGHSSAGYVLAYRGSNQLYLETFDGGGNPNGYSTNSLTPNQWNHVAVVRGGGTYTFYINGIPSGTVNDNASNITNSQNLNIGRCIGHNGGYFNGKIDEVRMYNTARTPTQIAWDYNRGAPIGHWQFNECSGTTAYDISGNNRHGTITIGSSGSNTSIGNCNSGVSTEAWNNGTNGKFNSSISLDGTDDFVTLPTYPRQNNFSVSAWFKLNNAWNSSSSGQQMIYNAEGSDPDFYIYFDSADQGKLKAASYNPSNNLLSITNSWEANRWYHVTVTYNSLTGSKSLYIDGNLENQAVVANLSLNTNGSHRIGQYALGGMFFNGQIDDVRIYNYPLTQQLVNTLFSGGAIVFGD